MSLLRRFWERNFDLFEGFTAPRRPGAGKLPSLIYLVLFHVNLYILFPSQSTHVFPCFFAFSSASELWRAASAASVPVIAEGVEEVVAVLAFVEIFETFGVDFAGSNLIPKLPNHLVLAFG